MKKTLAGIALAVLLAACGSSSSGTQCYTKDFGDGVETICGNADEGCIGGQDPQGTRWVDCG